MGNGDILFDSPTVPDDMIFEILRRSEWKEILTIRQVSRSCHSLSKAREIWIRLVHSFLKPRASAPQIHFLERPIHCYTSTELESIWLKWMKARHARYHPRPDMFKAPKYFALHAPGYGRHDDSLSYLVEGGRWFVEFGVDGSALYYDLEDEGEPCPCSLIPPIPGNPARVSVFPPYILRLRKGLSFLTGIAYLLNNSWTTDIWHVHMPDTGECVTKLLAVHRKRFSLLSVDFSVEASDLSFEMVAYRTQIASGSTSNFPVVTLVQWPLVGNDAANVPRRVLFPDHSIDGVSLLPSRRLLVHCTTTTTMFNYETSTLFNFMPTRSQASLMADRHVIRTLRSPGCMQLGARVFLSRLDIVPGSGHKEDLVTQMLVVPIDRGGAYIFKLTITTHGTVLAGHTTLVGSMEHDLNASHYFAGSSYSLSNRGDDLQRFVTYTWTQGEEGKRSHLNVKLTRIPCKNGMRHLMGTLYKVDEDSGRMLFFCERLRVMTVFDLA